MRSARSREIPRRGGVRWLERPLTDRECALGWLLATVLFVAATRVAHGISAEDDWESLGPAVTLARGNLSCMYPQVQSTISLIAPVFPLFAAAVVALARLGASTVFPTGAALGNHCDQAIDAWSQWFQRSRVTPQITLTAYAGWAVLMLGALTLLRTTSRGRTRAELVALGLLAVAPPVFMCVTDYFHPEDLFAMGLALAALAAVRNEKWLLAGVLFALAVLSQQFALLVLVPVMVTTLDRRNAPRLVLGGVLCTLVVLGPIAVATSGRVLTALSGAGATYWVGNVWIYGLHLSGFGLFALSRATPLALAAGLAVILRRRLGPLTHSGVLLPLVTVSLALRLVFEVNVFSYYYMALAVALVLGDVVGGRVRPLLILWLVVFLLFYNPFPYPHQLVIVWLPPWYAQAALVGSGLLLALRTLAREARVAVATSRAPVESVPAP
jgi:hypothetical protein